MDIKWSDFAKENLHDFVKYSKMESPIEYVEKTCFKCVYFKRLS